jgi:glucoamylase
MVFWRKDQFLGPVMRETTVYNVTTGGRSGMGPVPLTVALLNFDLTLGCDPVTFQPCSNCALSTLKVVTGAHKDVFSFTQNLPPDQPPPSMVSSLKRQHVTVGRP